LPGLRQERRELTIDPDLSASISIEELNTALLAVKSGKAAGFDGVYQEFIKNSGQRTKEWTGLFNDILTSGKIPKLFKYLSISWRDGLMLKFMQVVPCAKLTEQYIVKPFLPSLSW
jgi:hypothetical protein